MSPWIGLTLYDHDLLERPSRTGTRGVKHPTPVGEPSHPPDVGPLRHFAPMSTAPTGHDSSLHDRRIERIVPLATPAELLREQPLSAEDAEFVVGSRDEVGAILDREDPRLLVIVGPCSVHDPIAALDYAHRLSALA